MFTGRQSSLTRPLPNSPDSREVIKLFSVVCNLVKQMLPGLNHTYSATNVYLL